MYFFRLTLKLLYNTLLLSKKIPVFLDVAKRRAETTKPQKNAKKLANFLNSLALSNFVSTLSFHVYPKSGPHLNR